MTPDAVAAFRFGYGPAGAGAAHLADLAGPDSMAARYPVLNGPEVRAMIEAAGRLRRDLKGGRDDPALRARADDLRRLILDATRRALLATLARAVATPCGLRERLVAFWADHFTVSGRGPQDVILSAAMVEEAIRPNLTGSFADMLVAASLHPAMISYLDLSSSTGPNSAMGKRKGRGLNENFAREVIELHSLGVGAGYSQQDVRELAGLLAGVSWRGKTGFAFNADRAEPGAQTVLGKAYAGESLDVVRQVLGDLARRPETADHIGRKLAVHFVSDDPDPDLVAALAAAFRQGQGALLPVYEVLLHHPAAAAPALMKARQPWDFVVAALRALEVGGDEIMGWPDARVRRWLIKPLAAMGQRWKQPPGPDGWAEDFAAWITPAGLAGRISWAMTVPEAIRRPLPDPRMVAQAAFGAEPPETVLWAASRAETRAEAIGVILASPMFNRR